MHIFLKYVHILFKWKKNWVRSKKCTLKNVLKDGFINPTKIGQKSFFCRFEVLKIEVEIQNNSSVKDDHLYHHKSSLHWSFGCFLCHFRSTGVNLPIKLTSLLFCCTLGRIERARNTLAPPFSLRKQHKKQSNDCSELCFR